MTYALPPRSLLDTPPAADEAAIHAETAEVTRALNEALSGFDVDARVAGHTRGAAATRYEVELGAGVRVEQVERLERSLASAVGVASVRLTGVVRPGVIGLEVENKVRDVVPLARLLEGLPSNAHPLDVPIGADIEGRAVVGNLGRLPHLLVAGTTGSGKSVAVNAMLVTLLLQNAPDRLRLVLIDPKRVELASYADVPHLARPLVTEVSEAARALEEVVEEMESRYAAFEAAGVRDIGAHNSLARASGRAPLPYVVVVVDELADLMMSEGKRVEKAIVRIGQKARAAGIHLVLATQRPSADVVTGLIKANVPSRLVLTVASMVDSKVALDATGAQALGGKGDALYRPVGAGSPIRLQTPWVSDDELERVVDAWVSQEVQAMKADAESMAEARRHVPSLDELAEQVEAEEGVDTTPQAPPDKPVTMAEVVVLLESMTARFAESLKDTRRQGESIVEAFSRVTETYQRLINDAINREAASREALGRLESRVAMLEARLAPPDPNDPLDVARIRRQKAHDELRKIIG